MNIVTLDVPGHMITAFLQLDQGFAVETTLPAFFLGFLKDPVGLFIPGAIS